MLSAELSKSVVKVNFVLLSAIFCEVECLILFVIFVVVFFFFFFSFVFVKLYIFFNMLIKCHFLIIILMQYVCIFYKFS